MTDPFEALRSPLFPVDPDPEFAATLRARLQRALSLPRGVSMSATSTPVSATVSARTAITPYLAVATAAGHCTGTPKRSAPVRAASRS